MYQDKDAYLQLWKLTKMATNYGLKISKKIITDLLKKLANGKRITEEGKKAIKELTKEDKLLSMAKIKQKDLKDFKKQCKELGVTFVTMKDSRSDTVTVFFKEEDRAKLERVIDKMEEIANKKDAIEEKRIYDLMSKLNFKKIDENVYSQEQVMSAEQIASMKKELDRKGVKSDVTVTEVIDENRYKTEFRVSSKDKEKVKKPLSQLINDAIEKSKEKANELKEKVIEKAKEVMER